MKDGKNEKNKKNKKNKKNNYAGGFLGRHSKKTSSSPFFGVRRGIHNYVSIINYIHI